MNIYSCISCSKVEPYISVAFILRMKLMLRHIYCKVINAENCYLSRKTDDKKLEWMYKDKTDSEEYLLGRRIDKAITEDSAKDEIEKGVEVHF